MSACQFSSLWASQLVKFSDYGSRSLQACFTYYKYDKLWGLPRRVFTLFVCVCFFCAGGLFISLFVYLLVLLLFMQMSRLNLFVWWLLVSFPMVLCVFILFCTVAAHIGLFNGCSCWGRRIHQPFILLRPNWPDPTSPNLTRHNKREFRSTFSGIFFLLKQVKLNLTSNYM